MTPIEEPGRAGRAADAGFTLIEALIATVLMVVILTSLAIVTSQWLPNWNRGFARVQRTELVSRGLERIVADLASAQFVPSQTGADTPLFDGAELSVTFVRGSIGPDTRPGLEIIRIAETTDERGLAVVRTRMPFAPSSATSSSQPSVFADPVVLMRQPFRLVLAYAGPDGVWRPGWSGERQLPNAVRLTIRDAANARTLAMSTATRVHVGAPAECAREKQPGDCNTIEPRRRNDDKGKSGDNGNDAGQATNAR